MCISIALGASTITELTHEFKNYKRGKKGLSVGYLWLRSLLFIAFALVCFLNPERTSETLILAVMTLLYVLFYSILLILYYKMKYKSKKKCPS